MGTTKIFTDPVSPLKSDPYRHLACAVLKNAVVAVIKKTDLDALDWLRDPDLGLFFAENTGFNPFVVKKWAENIDEQGAR